MLISDSPRFLFIAVPKTGTSSIEEVLGAHASCDYPTFNKHALLSVVRESLNEPEPRFTFAFVRDPYDWIVSWFFYRKRPELADPEHPRHFAYTGHMGFDEFLDTFAEREIFLRQTDFISDADGDVRLDYLGRFETLEEDFARLCHKLGLPRTPLPRLRRSDRTDTDTLWTPRNRRIVNLYFEKDFEKLGYSICET
ncbi:MAG: sulfotransferase family 2 domain-containing protein [Pseudomonadota bacterium]